MCRLFLPVLVAFVVVCASCRTTPSSSSAVHTDIAEAVFRYVAQPALRSEEDSHELNLVHKVYFLRIDGRDPSPEFLRCLRDMNAPVKPLSSSVERGAYRYDARTGERGAAFYIHDIQLIGRKRATAGVDLNPGGALRASGSIYHLVMKDGKWVVVGEKLRWIS